MESIDQGIENHYLKFCEIFFVKNILSKLWYTNRVSNRQC